MKIAGVFVILLGIGIGLSVFIFATIWYFLGHDINDLWWLGFFVIPLLFIGGAVLMFGVSMVRD